MSHRYFQDFETEKQFPSLRLGITCITLESMSSTLMPLKMSGFGGQVYKRKRNTSRNTISFFALLMFRFSSIKVLSLCALRQVYVMHCDQLIT